MTDQSMQHQFGRPSKYLPEHCEKVVEQGKRGLSPAQMAAEFDVARQTLFNWANQHEDFLAALSRAQTHCQAWWEAKGMAGIETREFNAAVWKVSMQARFRDDYTERRITSGAHSMQFWPAPTITNDMTPEEAAAAYKASIEEC